MRKQEAGWCPEFDATTQKLKLLYAKPFLHENTVIELMNFGETHQMNLKNLKAVFASHGCNTIYVKLLAANDNSKNQVYLAGSFDILNIFPVTEVINEPSGS